MASKNTFIGLGSNVGDRLRSLQNAVEALHARDLEVSHVSRVYESAALTLDGKSQADYLNLVLMANTHLSPRVLLARCMRIEWKLGRRKESGRWMPRPIDIDILLFEGISMTSDSLTIPHPEMMMRSFVMLPLREILNERDADRFFIRPGAHLPQKPRCVSTTMEVKIPNLRVS